jgi:hypothetical protein
MWFERLLGPTVNQHREVLKVARKPLRQADHAWGWWPVCSYCAISSPGFVTPKCGSQLLFTTNQLCRAEERSVGRYRRQQAHEHVIADATRVKALNCGSVAKQMATRYVVLCLTSQKVTPACEKFKIDS